MMNFLARDVSRHFLAGNGPGRIYSVEYVVEKSVAGGSEMRNDEERAIDMLINMMKKDWVRFIGDLPWEGDYGDWNGVKIVRRSLGENRYKLSCHGLVSGNVGRFFNEDEMVKVSGTSGEMSTIDGEE